MDSFADPEPSARYLNLRTQHLGNDDGGGAGTCEVVTDRGRVIATGLLRSRYVPPLPKMPREFRMPSAEARAEELEPKSVLDAIGGRVEAADSGARLVVAADPRLRNFSGVLHGGALMGLADSLGGFCAFLNLPDGATGTATVESKTNFFRAVRQGRVTGVARPLHVGRTFIVVQTDLRDEEGRHVAQITQTQAVLR